MDFATANAVVAAERRSADVAGRQARVPATLGCETGTRARKREHGNESRQNGDHAARPYGDHTGKSPSFPDSSQF